MCVISQVLLSLLCLLFCIKMEDLLHELEDNVISALVWFENNYSPFLIVGGGAIKAKIGEGVKCVSMVYHDQL